MKNRFVCSAVVALMTAGAALCGQAAQQSQQAPAAQAPAGQMEVAKQPRPKSQQEVQALQAIFQAQDPDARIKAGDEFLVKFADSEFKPFILMMIADTYRQKGDANNMIVYAERTLEADPKNYMAMLMIGQSLAQRTREFDLDKEEKLARAEKYAHQVEDLLKTAPKPRPDITDEQWTAAKKDFEAQAHEVLGMSALVRKKYDVAISEFKTAVDTGSSPDPATEVRLGAAYNQAGKYDDAVAVLEKVMAKADVNPTIKQFAQAERARAIQAKNGGKAATPAPGASATQGTSTPAPAQPETKKP